MNVLSLFDGISCGQEALKRAGIEVDTYYASEIDKYAIQVAQKNYPNTIQLGDVSDIDFTQFINKINLAMGGSPCQDLSVARKGREGLEGSKSGLFWKFVEALNVIKPKYFLFENVASMKQADRDIITQELGVEPILIDSALLSGQQRKRLYWTNISDVTQPEDKGILLRDILIDDKNKNDLIHSPKAIDYMNRQVKDGRTHWDFQHHSDIRNDKSSAVVANFFKGVPYNVLIDDDIIRKFDPIECERLQTLPDNYTEGVSNTQRYKMIGNGWNVDTIVHILKNIKNQ